MKSLQHLGRDSFRTIVPQRKRLSKTMKKRRRAIRWMWIKSWAQFRKNVDLWEKLQIKRRVFKSKT